MKTIKIYKPRYSNYPKVTVIHYAPEYPDCYEVLVYTAEDEGYSVGIYGIKDAALSAAKEEYNRIK